MVATRCIPNTIQIINVIIEYRIVSDAERRYNCSKVIPIYAVVQFVIAHINSNEDKGQYDDSRYEFWFAAIN